MSLDSNNYPIVDFNISPPLTEVEAGWYLTQLGGHCSLDNKYVKHNAQNTYKLCYLMDKLYKNWMNKLKMVMRVNMMALNSEGMSQQYPLYNGLELLSWARVQFTRIYSALIQDLVNMLGMEPSAVRKALDEVAELLVERKTILFAKQLTKVIVKHSGTYQIKVNEEEIKELLWAYTKLKQLGLTHEDFKIRVYIDTLIGINNKFKVEIKLKKKEGPYYIFRVPTKYAEKLESKFVDILVVLDNQTSQLILEAHEEAEEVIDAVKEAIKTGNFIMFQGVPLIYSQPVTQEHLACQSGSGYQESTQENYVNPITQNQMDSDSGIKEEQESHFEKLVKEQIKKGKEIVKRNDLYVRFNDNTVVIDTRRAIEKFKKWSIRDFSYEVEENGKIRNVSYSKWEDFVSDKGMPVKLDKSRRNVIQRIRYTEIFLEFTKGVINEEAIEKFFEWLQYEKVVRQGKIERRGIAKGTVGKYKSHIKKFFKFLKLRDYQDYVGKITSDSKKENSINNAEVIDENDIKNLILEIRNSRKLREQEKDELIGLILLEATTGLRTSEALRLLVGDVDFENRIVLVRSEITKKNYSRVVYITEEVANYLHNTVVRKYNKAQNDYLFSPSLPGFRDPSKGRITQRLKRIGINFNMKSLRKFYTTMTRNPSKKAFELLIASKVLDNLEFLTAGHKTLEVVEGHYDYTKISGEEILKKSKLLDRLLAQRDIYDVVFNNIKFLE